MGMIMINNRILRLGPMLIITAIGVTAQYAARKKVADVPYELTGQDKVDAMVEIAGPLKVSELSDA
jgi:hypothetical protein